VKSLIVDATGKLFIDEVPIPEINEYQALVKMISNGICNGTDMKLIHGNFKNFDTYPAILGHEGVGKVIQKGGKVTSFNIGDNVLLPFLEGMIGQYYSGWGAYSEYAVVGDWNAMAAAGKGPGTPDFPEGSYAQQVLPPDIDPVKGSMIVTFREVLSATKRFGFEANRSLVVFGAGPVGLCFTRFAKLLGLSPVIVFDVVEDKLPEAKNAGADYVFNSLRADVRKEVRELLPAGADFVVDAVGINQLINQAMELVKYNGKICCYGISPKLQMDLDWSKAPYNWTLQFLQWPSKLEESQAHNQIISWLRTGAIHFDDYISDIIPFENVLDAFQMVEEHKAKKKIIVQF
jgi:threonine dehydrogenase-like Zn-dependent dehydrogenase